MASTVFVNSVTLSQAAWFQDVDNVAYQFLSGVAGTNTITAAGPAGLGAYAAGLKFRFIPAATNTGATTINITGTAALGARNIFSGGAALTGGELVIGIPVEIIDDGTQFNIASGVFYKQGVWTPSVGGTATYTTQTGTYVKIGKMVAFVGSLTINLIGTGSTTNITGLPFAATQNAALSVSNATSLATNMVSVTAAVSAGFSTVFVNGRTVASASESGSAIFGNGAGLNVAGIYFV